VLLPETGLDEALVVAERTRAAIAALHVRQGGVSIGVDTSVGVAALSQHVCTREDLVRAADQAAYAAKQAGKGRVGRPEDAALTLERNPEALTRQLKYANVATVQALAAAVDAKDPYTRGHSQRVSAYAVDLARALGLAPADVARVRLAGLLHDVGKIGVPDAILTKTGTLSTEEFAVLRQHPVIGERLLAAVPFLREILPAVRHHHERWDGQGYPDGLAGAAIPRDAAIIMLADALDAMTSSRTYRPALSWQEACKRVHDGSGVQFDPQIVAAFATALAEGTLTPLSAGGTTLLDPGRVA
jgi:putative nucleotidyltransferase with HDIG domain